MGGDLIKFKSDWGPNNYRKRLYIVYVQAFKIFFLTQPWCIVCSKQDSEFKPTEGIITPVKGLGITYLYIASDSSIKTTCKLFFFFLFLKLNATVGEKQH